MKKLLKEVYDELLLVLKGKTLDTLIPPILFAIVLNVFNLEIALITSLTLSLLILIIRLLKKESVKYSILGFIALFIAALFSYLSKNASNYFLPDIIGSAISVVITLISLIIRKPLAAYVSHFTRGWPIAWFWRNDIRPAYQRVTIIWLLYFIFRTILETSLYFLGTVSQYVWINTLLGIPLLIVLLTVSYIYGMWSLKRLGGPSVDEFINKSEPPYKGQTKGF